MHESPHRRLNLLTGEWVLVSPHRMARPWSGAVEAAAEPAVASHDPACPLCPGVTRASGLVNPVYEGPYAFANDFPALLEHAEVRDATGDPLFVQESEAGVCRVLCHDPDHSLTLARMGQTAIGRVLRFWRDETKALAARGGIGAVTLFENRGAMMGASSPHPHAQVWATQSVPSLLAAEQSNCRAFRARHGVDLLPAYAAREVAARERVIAHQADFVAVTPFWAAWPFETLIAPLRPIARMTDLTDPDIDAMAAVLSRVLIAYDNLFQCDFPYSLGLHQAGFDDGVWDGYTLHIHLHPPLLRSAQVRKFMVGFEMFAMAQRDLTPEAAAERLRATSSVHYLKAPRA